MLRRVALAVVLLPTVAFAAPIETVVVTASPPDPVGNAAFSVATLSAADLHDSTELDRALAQVPGLSLFRRDSSLSANPTTQGVSLRSIAPSGAGRALVTLDGVPQNDPFGGWVIWSALPPEDIGGAQVVARCRRGAVRCRGADRHHCAGRGAGRRAGRGRCLAGAVERQARRGRRRHHAQAPSRCSPAPATRTATAGSPYRRRSAARPTMPSPITPATFRCGPRPRPGPTTLLSLRLGAYGENRDSGLVGATSSADGVTASLTLAHPETADDLGWRVQAWLRNSGFSNTSATVLPGRTGTTLSNDQYSTPALGWGFNAALRGSWSWLDWEVGGDARFTQGDSKEHYQYVAGAPTMNRDSGGRTFVGGLYVESAAHPSPGLLLTLGVRADQWASTGGHLIQSVLATGAVTVNQTTPSRSGVVPTARLGVRQELGDGLYVRSAAYGGFRAPTLNELYRPFRLGNNLTEANPGLTPEKLYGAEAGLGQGGESFGWDLTGFYNQLHGAVTNVTVAHGPVTVPGLGTVPVGGLLIQRQNAGNIDAYGLEIRRPLAGARLADA
ncbi:MAG: TonB-dependent receptor [Rhizomicrobium sp.]